MLACRHCNGPSLSPLASVRDLHMPRPPQRTFQVLGVGLGTVGMLLICWACLLVQLRGQGVGGFLGGWEGGWGGGLQT